MKGSTVFRHDDFETICAAASVGKATAQDLAKLERHTAECASCWQAYHDCVSVAALEFARAEKDAKLSSKEARECLDSDLFARRFFDRAEREGIVFSQQVPRGAERQPSPRSFSPALVWKRCAMPFAAAAILAVALSAGYLYRNYPSLELARTGNAQGPRARSASSATELMAANDLLRMEIDRLSRERAAAEERLRTSESSAQKERSQERKDFFAERAYLQTQLFQLQTRLLQGQRDLDQLRSQATAALRSADEQRERVSDLEASLVATQTELTDVTGKLKEESAALGRERELLAMGRDVSDLMGARNLHILDVVDTDARGKNRPAFGRIFFTEGKSLVFYAYDLNEAKMQKANYQYQVWAKKEGPNHSARRLGIFYSDDKAQNRWVFKCDDPKVVKEIDSVFVTLERPNSDPHRPEGARLMFAYLHGAPNHP